MEADAILNFAKSLGDQSRSSSNYGKLMLIRDIIMELENKKAEIKKDIERDSKYPDPFLDKL